MKSFIAWFIVTLSLIALGDAQQTISIPDNGWRLWLDQRAAWEKDSIYLPGEFTLSKLPLHPPTGGWGVLSEKAGRLVTLPSTVEEHFWGVTGRRPYKEEYFYEGEDSAVSNGNYLGVSWWWRDIDVPASFQGKHVSLTIRGARLRAEVFWEKQLVGYSILTEVPFSCDLTGAVKPGKKNRLAIRITNPGGRLDWLDTQLMTWGTTSQKFHKSHGFGGLDRALQLTAHEPTHMEDLWVLNTASARSVQVHALLRNTTTRAKRGTLKLEVVDPERAGTFCAAIKTDVIIPALSDSLISAELEYAGAQLWSLEAPKLYRLRATLLVNNEGESRTKRKPLLDTREVRFGFRWFEAEGVGKNAILRLNSERVRVVSAISWGFWGENGLWPTRQLAEREVRAAKRLGMNCIQFHRNTGKTEVLDMQDSLGLLRYMEPGGGQTAFGESFSLYAPSPTTPVDASGQRGEPATFAERYMEAKVTAMVRAHRSHPSLVLYCLQNEIHPDLRNGRIFHMLRLIHREDPSRIVVLKSGFPSGTPGVNQAWMQPYSDTVFYDEGNASSGWWDDHTVGGPGVWRDDMYKSPQDFTHRSTDERQIVMWGEMLGAAAPDNHAAMLRELRSQGGKSYDITDHEEILASYERFLDSWGFRGAFPTADRLFTALGNKAYDFWGRVMETARLAEANDYFVMSGWESTSIENHSGLVDNLRNFKGDPALLAERLRALRPVIKSRSLVLEKGAKAVLDIFLLNETHTPHARTMRVWMEEPGQKRTELGTFDVPPYAPDRFVYPVAAGISTPPLSQEGPLALSAEIALPETSVTRETLLVLDTEGGGTLPKKVGVLSSQPGFAKSFQILPSVKAEPYTGRGDYDAIIAADRLITPPAALAEPERKIQKTQDEELYRSVHYGSPENFDYLFPGLPKEKVRVTLKFVELFQNAPGVRVFDVALNGLTVLKNFDVFKAAGGKDIAFDTAFTVRCPGGLLEITVPAVSAGSARIAAIKIESGDSVTAITCGGKEYTDKQGLVWKPYEPKARLDDALLEKVRSGTGLIVLAEGGAAVPQYAERLARAGAFRYLGHVGEARASWMGSWYFVRKHALFEGLPVECALGSYYQVPVTNADGVLVEGSGVEVVAGYSRDHDRNVGAGCLTATLGKGKIVFFTLPGLMGGTGGIHPLIAKRLLANSLRFLKSQ
jgi:beta-galactosidase